MSDTDRKALLSKNESWYNPRQEVVREAMEYGVPLHVQINADAGIRLYGVINRSEQPYVETDQEDDSPLHLAEIQLDSHGDLQAQPAHLRDIRSVLHHADEISDKSYGLTMKDVTKTGSGLQVSFTYSSGAEEKPDLSLPLDSKLESRLHQLVLDKETKMESAYPIRFAKEGEVISKPNTLLPQEARMPTVPELDALAKALRISEVSLPDKNQKKLEVFYSTGHNNWMGHQYDGLFVAPGEILTRSQLFSLPLILIRLGRSGLVSMRLLTFVKIQTGVPHLQCQGMLLKNEAGRQGQI